MNTLLDNWSFYDIVLFFDLDTALITGRINKKLRKFTQTHDIYNHITEVEFVDVVSDFDSFRIDRVIHKERAHEFIQQFVHYPGSGVGRKIPGYEDFMNMQIVYS